jgi:hypothetical protein
LASATDDQHGIEATLRKIIAQFNVTLLQRSRQLVSE